MFIPKLGYDERGSYKDEICYSTIYVLNIISFFNLNNDVLLTSYYLLVKQVFFYY